MLRKDDMLEGFSAPRVADFYDNESSRFQHTEMSEAVSAVSLKYVYRSLMLCKLVISHGVYGLKLLHYSALNE